MNRFASLILSIALVASTLIFNGCETKSSASATSITEQDGRISSVVSVSVDEEVTPAGEIDPDATEVILTLCYRYFLFADEGCSLLGVSEKWAIENHRETIQSAIASRYPNFKITLILRGKDNLFVQYYVSLKKEA